MNNTATILPSTKVATNITIHDQLPVGHPCRKNVFTPWATMDALHPCIIHWHDGSGAGVVHWHNRIFLSIYDFATALTRHLSGYHIAPDIGWTFMDFRKGLVSYVAVWPSDVPPVDPKEQSLNQVLGLLGFTTKPAGDTWTVGSKRIIRDNKTIFTGDAQQVWAWLRHERLV